MGQGLDNEIDHLQVVLLLLILASAFGQIARNADKPMRKKLGEIESQSVLRPQKGLSIIDDMGAARRNGAHRRHVWNVEKDRYLAENRSGIGDDINLKIAFQDFYLSFDQNVKQAGLFTFGKQDRPGLESVNGDGCTQIQDRGHSVTLRMANVTI